MPAGGGRSCPGPPGGLGERAWPQDADEHGCCPPSPPRSSGTIQKSSGGPLEKTKDCNVLQKIVP